MPFIETAQLNNVGAAASQGSSDEDICHVAGIRYRVTGTGILRTTLYSYDEVRSKVLGTITMSSALGKAPFMVTNFMSQRTVIRIETTAIDEIFEISRIILFIKPVFTSHPG